MKKVLIITYYWPPSGGAGVQRWLKFVKYLREFGWEPIVYTTENPEAPVLDHSLEKDIPENITVLKTKIWEPYNLYKSFIGQKKEEKINAGFLSEKEKPGMAEKISVWIRGNWFIPDARKFWIKPSVKFLAGQLKKNPVNAIVSTGPPHSMHLIALELKKKINIPWLADFRDPWTNIDFYKDLKLTKTADAQHKKLEKEVLQNADKVISIGETISEEFKNILGKQSEKFSVITNGYDEDDLYKGEIIPDKKFSIAHIGSITPSRNPVALWKTLLELVKENSSFGNDLEIKLVGKADVSVEKSLKEFDLEKFVNKISYLPHSEVAKLQQQAQVLLLLLNNTPNAKGILTGKFFEYLSVKRPILCIGSEDGDAAKIIRETTAGVTCDFSDSKKMQEEILKLYSLYREGKLISYSKGIEKYSRKELTKKLVEILDKVIN
ncbi:MAG: glycosyltransferase family 4 protein [Bacteroidetes bacterium]|nr:glycosyltransferase family 4 protein [Bacteroidota bacterium]